MIDIAKITGEVKDEYVQVITRMGVKRYVKPMFAFPLVARSYKSWITKHKDKFMAVIAFEQDILEKGVMLGLVPLPGNNLPAEGLDDNVIMFSEKHRVWLNDTDNEMVLDLLENGGWIKLGSKDATEHGLLGDKTKKHLEDLCDKAQDMATAVAQLTVSTAVGPSSVPINAASFVQLAVDFVTIKTALADILSEKVKLE